jgi:hypothetical protein
MFLDEMLIMKNVVMVSKIFAHIPIDQIVASADDIEDTMPTYKPEDDIFLSLVHVALKLRADIQWS